MPNQNMGLLGRVAGLRNGMGGGSPGLNPTQSLWGGGTPNNGWTPGVGGTGGGGMAQPTMGGGMALGGNTGSGGGGTPNPWGPMIEPWGPMGPPTYPGTDNGWTSATGAIGGGTGLPLTWGLPPNTGGMTTGGSSGGLAPWQTAPPLTMPGMASGSGSGIAPPWGTAPWQMPSSGTGMASGSGYGIAPPWGMPPW